jgi:hypothetical protein
MIKTIQENRKLSIIILIELLLFLIISVTFGRYVYNVVHNYIIESKGFYFNSSVLKPNGKSYSINNWDGVNSYPFTIDINNKKNDEIYTQSDITYTIEVICPSSVTCVTSQNSGTIYKEAHTDSYTITVTPRQTFEAGDTITINTKVTSTFPYTKELSATYHLGVQKANFSYSIDDAAGEKFCTLNLTNSIGYYDCNGAQKTIQEYAAMTPAQQAQCYSAIIVLTFDPGNVLLDMTSNTYHNRLQTDYQEQQIGSNQYVKKYSFKVDPNSNTKVIFYKTNINANYTYTGVNGQTPIINVVATTPA